MAWETVTIERHRTRRLPAIVLLAAAVPVLMLLAALPQPPSGSPATDRPADGEPVGTVLSRSQVTANGSILGLQQSWTLVGAGDIAPCGSPATEATARLIESIEGTVFTAGDNAYPNGSARDFADCYGPTWGRFRDRTRPALGTHEYDTLEAAAYFDYFGDAAGPRGLGYYSYTVGPWLVVVLNTNCREVPGGCGPNSPQAEWLRDELVDSAEVCTVAVSGHPRFSSGFHGNNANVRHLFNVLYHERVELLVSGHDHDYERFVPVDAEGFVDQSRGVRQFVVGTGGRSLRPIGERQSISEAASADTFGVLKLTLFHGRYEWAFIGIAGEVVDEGKSTCH